MEEVVKIHIFQGDIKLDKLTLQKSDIRLVDWSLMKEKYDTVKKMQIVLVSPKAKEFLEKHF